jgi:tetratricopeptide (TPR) repeat protein
MNSLMAIGSLYLLKQDHRWQETWDKALALSRELGDIRAEANLLMMIGSAYGIDSLDRNMEYLQAAMKVSQKLDDKRTELRLLGVFGDQFERNGDYYRWLTEFEQPRLTISRQIGDRIEEGFALMHSGQIKALYLGDYVSGLAEVEESLKITENLTSRLYPLLRLIQIQSEMGKNQEALANLEVARPISEQAVNYIGRAGFSLVAANLYNVIGGKENFDKVLEITAHVFDLVNSERVSRQYAIGAYGAACMAHLGLAALSKDEGIREDHLRQALESSQRALDIYNQFGFVQIIESATEEVFFRHSQALAANRRKVEAREMVECSYGEMMRKYEMIPASSLYRKTFLEIRLHQEISQAAALP